MKRLVNGTRTFKLKSLCHFIFSTRQNQRLAAGGGKEEDDDDENWTELDQQAAEDYLDWRQEAIRAKMDADLIQRTIPLEGSL
jgi:hypothetical protein